MTTHHTAQGLASLGRHGDTMLVHMSPHEVAGLNYLAKKQGTKLTINPNTGLPEAFSLGGFFSSFLPTIAGMAFAPETGGFSMAPLLAGAATGAGLAAIKGEDPLMGTLMGGLGGYGGGQLGPALGAAQPGGWVAGQAVKGAANPLMDTTVNTALSGAQNSMMANPILRNASNNLIAGGFGSGSGAGFMDPAVSKLTQAGTGLKNIATGQPGAYDAFKAAGGTPMQLAMPVGGAVLGGLEPSDLYGEPIKPSNKGKYDPYATLNLGNDTGLRLVAEGGYIEGDKYAVGGTVTTGGLRDLYSATDTQTNPALSRDGYGVGRLDSLAREQSLNQAQTMGYAMGGPVSFADGGDANKEDMMLAPIDQSMGISSLMPATTPTTPGQSMSPGQVQNTATALSDTSSSDSSIIAQVANNLRNDPNYQPKNPIEAAIAKQIKGTDQTQQGQQGLGSLGAQPSQPMAPSYNPSVAMGPTYYAGMNAPRGFADGGETSLNLDKLPTLNVNTGKSEYIPNVLGRPGDKISQELMRQIFIDPVRNWAVPALDITKTPGLRGLFGYAEGGYLDGQGDGMSDSIPATIEGKQPARLADGEFVVPADVVSHIGNGSSKAGSQRLYSMLDRVRKARTGHTKQGKQIKPEKYMPA